jgi:hypothetical protein
VRFARAVRAAAATDRLTDLLAGLAATRLTDPRAPRFSGVLLATSDGPGVRPL